MLQLTIALSHLEEEISFNQRVFFFLFLCCDDCYVSYLGLVIFLQFLILWSILKFMNSPARTCWLALKGAVRSTSFLSAFVGIFQVSVLSLSLFFSFTFKKSVRMNSNMLLDYLRESYVRTEKLLQKTTSLYIGLQAHYLPFLFYWRKKLDVVNLLYMFFHGQEIHCGIF